MTGRLGVERRLQRLEHTAVRGTQVLRLPDPMPHIIEFALSRDYLGVCLFPRQATLLKLMFFAVQLLTDYDHRVLAEWTGGFSRSVNDDGRVGFGGQYGIVPDVLDRIEVCRADGRAWFREVIMVAGRRGSKGFLGAVAASYVLWRVMATMNPQEHYGIPPGKQLHVMVFAGQQYQAQVNQWRDLAEIIKSSACFVPYVAQESRDTLWLYSPAQVAAGGVPPKDAAFIISAREATGLAGRGPASLVQLYDEMAHMEAGGSNRPADEIYSSASPGTAQFRTDSLLYQASSPWQQTGKFYSQYLRALATDPITGDAEDPDMLVAQLPSAELYRDWQRTADPTLLAWPDGPPFTPLLGPIFDAADEARHRRADPHGYDVEFGAQWAATLAAYLPREDVDRVFAPYQGRGLQMRSLGTSEFSYLAHADPSVTGANFALVVAHAERDPEGERHVIVDLIKVWRPQDFPGHRINYEVVTDSLKALLTQFRISSLTFDQFNSAGLLDRLKAFAREDDRVLGLPTIHEPLLPPPTTVPSRKPSRPQWAGESCMRRPMVWLRPSFATSRSATVGSTTPPGGLCKPPTLPIA